jgi:hypothetical protein
VFSIFDPGKNIIPPATSQVLAQKYICQIPVKCLHLNKQNFVSIDRGRDQLFFVSFVLIYEGILHDSVTHANVRQSPFDHFLGFNHEVAKLQYFVTHLYFTMSEEQTGFDRFSSSLFFDVKKDLSFEFHSIFYFKLMDRVNLYSFKSAESHADIIVAHLYNFFVCLSQYECMVYLFNILLLSYDLR